MTAIELLAPAKNLDSGKVAINYGADAVYMGADRFGARAAAGNSIADIADMVRFAHQYRSKVFVTLNTILFDKELDEAQKLIWQIYEAGADALIIQDLGILMMDLPPIPLHASTQTNNFDPERIRFLDSLGFERIVLARELSLSEISNIRSHTKADLEFFIHGALCVSLSGQCYFSQAVTGRSANRGVCSQMCRHPYNLLDAGGNKIALNSHLLSLKDLNHSDNLHQLVQAGITSLKIEGRLKDSSYVKNCVSFYRKRLDDVLEKDKHFTAASSGYTAISFEPDPEKSFNRRSTDYFLQQRNSGLINSFSPKSLGKYIGVVKSSGPGFLEIASEFEVNNGDGLCYVKDNQLIGFRVDKVAGSRLEVNETDGIMPGLELYRNYDHQFVKMLDADQSIRKIKASVRVFFADNQLIFKLDDEDGLSSELKIDELPEPARDFELFKQNLKNQLMKSGQTIFEFTDIQIDLNSGYFFRIASLNEIRRRLTEMHQEKRIKTFSRQDKLFVKSEIPFPKQEVDFSENISNEKAAAFYKQHGVNVIHKALEINQPDENQLLMTTRYCVKYELGACHRFQKVGIDLQEPLYLEDNNRKYRLHFDCKNCMMQIRFAP